MKFLLKIQKDLHRIALNLQLNLEKINIFMELRFLCQNYMFSKFYSLLSCKTRVEKPCCKFMELSSIAFGML